MGKEGSTAAGDGFVQALRAEANAHFPEVAHCAKRDEQGGLAGCWGAMTDFSRAFQSWEESFSKGLYLAGVECREDALPPAGWVKWAVPGFRFVRLRCGEGDTFSAGLRCLKERGYPLAGAVQDYMDVKNGVNYMCFPIKRL